MGDPLTLEIDTSQIDRFVQRFPVSGPRIVERELRIGLDDALGYTTVQVVDFTPDNTGILRDSIYDDILGVKADITSFGKSASAGLWPVSGALAKKEYGELLKPGEHGSTFGGAPASMALMRAAMRELEDRDACRLSKENGTWFRDELIAMCTELPDVVEVRGMGLMIGIELKGEAGVVCERLRKSPFTYRGKKMEGFWTNDAHSKVIRISPPLIVDRDLLRASLYSFAQALGHPNPEQYRAGDLERPYSPSELMNGVADETKYYGGRVRRFMEEVL